MLGKKGKTRRAQVRVHAYLKTNLGDDLLVRILCARYHEVIFWISCTSDAFRAFRDVPNIQRIPRVPVADGLLRRLKVEFRVNTWMRKKIDDSCMAVVHIGGSIFQQRTNWSHRLERFEASLLPDRPAFVIGANFGPFTSTEYLAGVKRFFLRVQDVCFRDLYSASLFEELSNIRVAPDVVFSIKRDCRREKSSMVVISVIDLARRSDLVEHQSAYLQRMEDLISACIARGLTITLVSFCAHEGDRAAVDALLNRLPLEVRDNVSVHHYQGDIEETIGLLARSRVVIATRLHAIILGFVLGKPTLPISYSKKIDRVLRDMDYSGPRVRVEEIMDMDMGSTLDEILNVQGVDVSEQAAAAVGQFAALDRELARFRKGGDPGELTN